MEDFLPARGVRFVRRRAFDWVAEVGRVTLMLRDVVRFLIPGLRSFGRLVQQMNAIGVGSLWLVVVVSLFTGAVAAVQAAYQFTAVVPMRYLGSVILRSVIIELGPVLTALVIGGRVGASIAAELGTMKVTEQIDALRAMAIHPVRYLVVPRVVAAVIMLPIITIFSDAIAIFGGYVVAITSIGVSSHTYTQSLKDFFLMKDLWSGLIKSFFFGGIIGTMGCFHGFATEGGAEGVGLATTHAVVASCVLVLISDYVLANVLFRFIFAA
ncbi:MAG: ABC transporter permease [Candidatus Eisenbacteria bacterium]|uniref:ABC transporter permease n=1 Tax=Eiseniibacteriota bacterium TaxID=2212470 RepID=A0A538UD86_UNCEI|nr:MAG: ABC transporter permease [Candidatus Eisenbacteria bacterium]